MTRLLMTSLISGLLCTAASAETCTLRNNYCVPFVGCFENGQDFFHGFTMGREEGPVVALTEDGTQCAGRWWRNAIGVGKARFSCENGLTGQARYTYFERKTGTAVGKGRTSDGDRVRFWAGHNYLAHVLSDQDETASILACVSQAAKRAEKRR